MSIIHAVTLLLVATSTATALQSRRRVDPLPPSVRTQPVLNILPINSTSSPTSSIAESEVYGWKSCDGVEAKGTVLTFRVTCCAPSDRPCEAPAEVDQDVELDGIPSRPISHLGRRLKLVRKEGPATLIEEMPYQNTTVAGGSLYRFFGRGRVTQHYLGRNLNIQYSYYDVESGEDEFCVQAYYKVVQSL